LRILADAWPLPLDLYRHSANWSFDDHAFTLLKGRNSGYRIGSKWIGATSPLSELSLSEIENGGRAHITGDYQSGVVGDVILVLDRPHFLRRGRRHYLSITDYI